MVLSSRDRRYVVVEMVWLGPSLERRRLRFSFQFNDVKDPDRLAPAPLFFAGGRRRRLSRGRPPRCQSPVSNLREKVPNPGPKGTGAPAGRSKTPPVRSTSRLKALSLVPRTASGKEKLCPVILDPPQQGRRRASEAPALQRSPPGAPPRRSGRRRQSRRRRRGRPPDC